MLAATSRCVAVAATRRVAPGKSAYLLRMQFEKKREIMMVQRIATAAIGTTIAVAHSFCDVITSLGSLYARE